MATAPIQIRFRTFLTALLLAGTAILSLGVGGLWQLTAHSPLTLLKGADQPVPVAAVFIPKQSPVVFSLLTQPDRLLSLRQILAPPQRRRQAEAEAERLKRSLRVNTGLDYESDIRPWLGKEVTAAIVELDLDHSSRNGQQPGYLIAAAVQRDQSARQFLQLFWQRQALKGKRPVFETLNGVRLIYSDVGQPGAAIATAAVGRQFVLFANDPQILRRSLNSAQSLPLSLADTPTFRQALAELPASRVGLAQVKLTDILPYLGLQGLASAASPAPDELPAELAQSTQPLILSVSLAPRRLGLLADWILQSSGQPMPMTDLPALTEPVQALKYLPQTTAIAIGSRNLPPVLDTIRQLGLADPFSPQLIADARRSDFAPSEPTRWDWVTGEYALGLLPRPESQDWVLIAERTADSETAIADLDAQAVTQGYSVSTIALSPTAGGTSQATAWTRLQADRRTNQLDTKVLGLHTQVDRYEIFATSLVALEQAAAAPEAALASSSAFYQATAPLATPNNGYLYLNWPQLEPIAAASLPFLNLAEVVAQPLFEHLEGIALSRYRGNSEQQGGLFIRLAENSKVRD